MNANLRRLGIALAASTLLTGCDLPKDPGGTTERIISTRVVRAGVTENPPFIRFSGDRVTGIEADIVRRFASGMGARVEWVRGGEEALVHDLEQRHLDLLAGGITSRTPFASKVGISLPYSSGGREVLLSAPGENRFLLRLDRFLTRNRSWIARRRNEGSAR